MDNSECWIHDTVEDAKGAYRVCYECGHVFMTKKDLMEQVRKLWGVESFRDTLSCPLCIHDW